MNVLVCNDDGISAEGLHVLAKNLAKMHKVIVVAPDTEKSASGHAITINSALSFKKIKFEENIEAYSLSGTPADCVKFAISNFSDIKFDVVVGGINRGSNTGTDVLYSGTVSCAAEATILNVKGIAISCTGRKDSNFQAAADFLIKNLEEFCKFELENTLLNINVPSGKIQGAVYTKLGLMMYNDKYQLIKDKKVKKFRLFGEAIDHDKNEEDCDVEYIKKGFITVTPIICYFTNFELLKTLKTDGKLKCE